MFNTPVTVESARWWDVLADVVRESHAISGTDIAAMVDGAVGPVGMSARLYLSDRAQRTLTPIGVDAERLGIDETVAGRCYQLVEPMWSQPDDGPAVLWLPMVDGTERLGVLRLVLPDGADPADTELHDRCGVLASLLGHIIATKIVYGDALHVARRTQPLTPAAELLWQLLPPLTFASKDLVVSAVLEPYDRIGGDAFDYAVDAGQGFVALFDAVGHDIQSGLTATIALAAIRNARRNGERDLRVLARRADDLIVANRGAGFRYVAAVLGWIDTETGVFEYLVAGHPPPLLLRANKTVRTLANGPRVPLGVFGGPDVAPSREQLEPGDRLLLYTDGITEARSDTGEAFGTRRLIEFAERSSAGGLPVPETLRRLSHAVLDHQRGRARDDSTLLMIDWRPPPPLRMPITPE